ncbi:MAG: hypothetical protein V3S39_00770 [Thermodesulfobacteriota bacterium]
MAISISLGCGQGNNPLRREPQRRSRPIKGLIRILLPGDLLIEVSSTRVDKLHIVGELSEWCWVRNSLEVEIPLPQAPLKMAVISGTSEWLNKSPGDKGFWWAY